MKFIAGRANGIFAVAPLFAATLGWYSIYRLYIIAKFLFDPEAFVDFSSRELRFYTMSAMLCVYFCFAFIVRLFTPRVLVECDDSGILIHSFGGDIELIPKSEVLSALKIEDDAEIYVYRGPYCFREMRISNWTGGMLKSGTLVIRTRSGEHRIHNVNNVSDATARLKSTLYEWEKELEKNIATGEADKRKERYIK